MTPKVFPSLISSKRIKLLFYFSRGGGIISKTDQDLGVSFSKTEQIFCQNCWLKMLLRNYPQTSTQIYILYAGFSHGCRVAKSKEGWPTTLVISVQWSDTKYVVKVKVYSGMECSDEVKQYFNKWENNKCRDVHGKRFDLDHTRQA